MASQQKSRIEPPQAVEVEADLLGLVLGRGDLMSEVQPLLPVPECFWDRRHRMIYSAMLDLYRRMELIDITTVTAELRAHLRAVGGRAYLAELMEWAHASHGAVKQAEIVRDRFNLRAMIAQCEQIRDRCYSGESSSEVANAWQRIAFDASTASNIPRGFRKISDDNPAFLQRVADFQSGEYEKHKLMTGISGLDRAIQGIPYGSLLTIAARTSQGKTQLGLQMAANVARSGVPAAILSLEMPHSEINLRLHSYLARIDSNRIRRKGQLTDSERHALTTASQKILQMPLYIDDSSAVTPAQLLANTMCLKAKIPGLRFVVVDYVQLMNHSTGNKSESRERVVADVSRRLKLMARDMGVVVAGLSQLNDQGAEANRRPGLWNLRESRAIGHDSDVVIFCWHYQEDGQDKAALVVGKNRQGVSGAIIPMGFVEGRWVEMDYNHQYTATE